ncbi:hypothetical protein BH10PSE12_BH10PSE12_12810 [soil metagenome]
MVGIGSVGQTIVASPAYLAVHGIPIDPSDLTGHRCIAGSGVRVAHAWPFGRKGEMVVQVAPCMTVNIIDATIAAAEAGLGLANVLSYQSADAVTAGRLVEVLAQHAPPAMPVSLLYDAGRAAMSAVQIFIDAMRERAKQGAWG